MAVEIEHVPRQTEPGTEIVSEPAEDDTVLDTAESPQRTYYRVEREIVLTDEKYIVHTRDGRGKEARTYWVEQTEDGEWGVVKLRINPNRGHPTVKQSGDLSTETVREALREQHGIELVN